MIAAMAGGALDIPLSCPSWNTGERRRPMPPEVPSPVSLFTSHERRHWHGGCTAQSVESPKPRGRRSVPPPEPHRARPENGLPPCIQEMPSGMSRACEVHSKRQFPGLEEGWSMRNPSVTGGKRTLTGSQTAEVCGDPFGPQFRRARVVIDPATGRPRRDFKSGERNFSDETGSVRKFDMDAHRFHSSRETPVAFPGWRGYPPSLSAEGQPIDYMVKQQWEKALGSQAPFKQAILSDSYFGSSPPHVAGDSTKFSKIHNPTYQADLQYMPQRLYDPATMGQPCFPKIFSQSRKLGFHSDRPV